MAELITGLSFLTLTDEITGITAKIDSTSPTVDPTRFSTYKFPWKRDLDVGSPAGTLYVEAVASYLTAKDRLHVEVPSGPATLTEDWQAFGGLTGVGWTFPLTEHWKVRPSVAMAISHLRNDASFEGPGADELASLIDGKVVGVDAWAAIGMGTLNVLYERPVGPVGLLVHARHTWTATDVFSASNSLLEGNDTSRILAVRTNIEGDTPLQLHGENVGWSAFASYVHFFDIQKQRLGFDHAYEVGGGFLLPLFEDLPSINLQAGILFGPHIEGWTVGLSLGI
jgi:hypothetical protein